MDDYFQDIWSTYDELLAVDQNLDGLIVIYTLLQGLGQKFAPFVAGLIAKLDEFTLEDSFAQIRVDEHMSKFQSGQRACSPTTFPPMAN